MGCWIFLSSHIQRAGIISIPCRRSNRPDVQLKDLLSSLKTFLLLLSAFFFLHPARLLFLACSAGCDDRPELDFLCHHCHPFFFSSISPDVSSSSSSLDVRLLRIGRRHNKERRAIQIEYSIAFFFLRSRPMRFDVVLRVLLLLLLV